MIGVTLGEIPQSTADLRDADHNKNALHRLTGIVLKAFLGFSLALPTGIALEAAARQVTRSPKFEAPEALPQPLINPETNEPILWKDEVHKLPELSQSLLDFVTTGRCQKVGCTVYEFVSDSQGGAEASFTAEWDVTHKQVKISFEYPLYRNPNSDKIPTDPKQQLSQWLALVEQAADNGDLSIQRIKYTTTSPRIDARTNSQLRTALNAIKGAPGPIPTGFFQMNLIDESQNTDNPENTDTRLQTTYFLTNEDGSMYTVNAADLQTETFRQTVIPVLESATLQ